ncbi:MAG: hypothetical protein HS111_37450 [Kofleriaceae bacterium]|nr:hypothetical protein [Kofleriaceae bacterium]MCL4227214.1 hypothetical protein [Myxococcales bacterium]
MKPWIELARAPAPGGGELSLHRRDRELVIRVDGQELMSSRRHASEDHLAAVGCAGVGAGRVLIGGLGMGFTLRAALAALPAGARLVVAELSAAVVAWNRELLGPEAAATLRDPRVRLEIADVAALLTEPGGYDAILLDVDNSPHALTQPANRSLYAAAGLAAAHRALRPGGRLAVWSAERAPPFSRRLTAAGFAVELHDARAHRGRGATHTIYVGRRPR